MYKVIVGLGNPGSKYDGTRHNIGFAVADALVAVGTISGVDDEAVPDVETRTRAFAPAALGGGLDRQGWQDRGALYEGSVRIGEDTLAVLKPRTFMNRSGEPVREFLAFKKVPITEVIALHDEIDLPVGVLRVKVGGGEGGHNGLRSLSGLCGGKEYARVRIGVGKPPPGPMFGGEDGIARWVLSRYALDEQSIVQDLVGRAAGAVVSLVMRGLGPTQNRFNR